MKKTFLLAVTALVALMAASCQKEEQGRVLTATIEQYEHNGDSKAYINADNYACWENGDEVSINGTTHTISINDDAQTATITNTQGLSGDLLAFYPASMVSNLSATGGTVSLPHLQTYETTIVNGVTYQKIQNPMAAYCPQGSDELKFRNLGALLKVTIQGSTSQDVRAIQVRGIENQMLCGKAQLTFDNNHQPALGLIKDGDNSVTLQIPAEATPASNTFYIVVPANTNFTQLTIAVLLKDGNTYITYCKTSLMNQSLPRNHIGAVSYTPTGCEDDTFLPDWMIRYTGSSQVTYSSSPFGEATIVNHTFSNGNGILLCDRPLTSIGDYAFQNCSSLASIDLPAGVTSIGDKAFYGCSSLTSISLPDNLTSIGLRAFNCCSSLASITLPAGVTSIGESAFEGCSSLTSINLPDNLTSIGKMAFYCCSSLTSIDLPAGVTSIGMFAFAGCSSLTSIDLPAGVTSIGEMAFYNCSILASITLPAGVTSIGDKAFYGCSSLTSISLPAGVTSIGDKAFYGCSSLASITLPAGVTSIGASAFENCSSLTRVNCYAINPPSLGSNTFTSIHSWAVLHVPSNAGDYSSWEAYFESRIRRDL